MNRALLQQALDALIRTESELFGVLDSINVEKIPHDGDDFHEALRYTYKAITALRTELAKPEPEPEAYIFQKFCSDSFGDGWEERIERSIPSYYTTQNIRPLYTKEQL